jgi:hypothetical protein
MRFLLHAAAVILAAIAALLCFKTIDGSTFLDALGFLFAGLACYWASSLPDGPGPIVVTRRAPSSTP